MKLCNDGTRSHHYLFETPRDGLRYVEGACRKCGDVKVLRAGFEEDTVKKQNPGAAFARGSKYGGHNNG